MKVMHPDGMTAVFMQAGLMLIADLEIVGPGWVSIGAIGSGRGLFLEADEWPSFVELVKEIDAARREIG